MKLLVLALRGLRPFAFGTSFDADRDFEAFDAFEAVNACDVVAFAFWDSSAHRPASSFATFIATRRSSATIWLVPTVSWSTNRTLAIR
jgi:hypothetical protein